MSQVWELDIKQHQKMLLLSLADFANDNGVCWPSQDSLAKKCGKSDRAIRRTLRELEELHIINTVHRGITAKQGGGRMTNIYFIQLPDVSSAKELPDTQGEVTGRGLPTNHQEPPLERDIGKFIPPTVDEINQYAIKKEIFIDADVFVDFYASKGWMVGRNKMKSWPHAVSGWAKRNKQRAKTNGHSKKFSASQYLAEQAKAIFNSEASDADIHDINERVWA